MPEPQVLPAMVQALLFCAIRAGLEPVGLLERAGIEFEAIETLDTPVPYTKALAIIREIENARPDFNLGLMMGKAFSTARAHVIGSALTHAPNLGTALQDFIRFQHIVNGGLFTWNFSQRSATSVVDLSAPTEWLADFSDIAWPSEAPIAMIMSLVRELCGQGVTPLEVSFRHRARGDVAEHEAFFGVSVRFSAPNNEIVLPKEALDLLVPKANRTLYVHLIEHIEASWASVSNAPATSHAVRQLFVNNLGQGAPPKSSVARMMGMSARTLLRRLHDEGTTFASILDGVRRDMAVVYLSDEAIPLAEVASRLGYSEPSPFFRAFSRWFGRTPTAYRVDMQRQRRSSH
jgi:AraC-like DNA-binding protein